MRYSNIVMLALRTLFSKIGGKVAIPFTNIFGSVVKSKSQIF